MITQILAVYIILSNMNMFSYMLTVLSVIYVFLGFKVIHLNQQSRLNRLFFALDLSLILWSVTSAFYISAYDEASCAFWYKLSSVGCYLFIGTELHFFLVFTKRDKLLHHWWMYGILYLPGIIFSAMEIIADFYVKSYSRGDNGWIVSAQADSPWFWASIAYIVVYVITSIWILDRFRKQTVFTRERKQASVIIFATFAALCVGMVVMVIVNILDYNIPDVTPIASAIWIIGIYYSIVKFKLMAMTPSFVAENLFQTIIDSVILTNPDGLILNINPETLTLLGYNQEELIGEPLEKVFISDRDSADPGISELLNLCPVRNVEASVISKNGMAIPIMLSISECNDNYGTRVGFVLASKDMTEFKLAKDKIQYLATHDSLTGLPNRLLFTQILSHSIQTAKRDKRKLAVFFIDLDRFKIINDTKGHDTGDQLLQEIASRYKRILREADVICRQGGDEFVILIENVHKKSDMEIIANTILSGTYQPIVLQNDDCRVTASIGISIYPQDGEDEQTLMKNADTAMYYAKSEGKNNYRFYTKDIQLQSTERMDIEKYLRFALERKELFLHYQAKVDVKTGKVNGVEALLRWNNPILGSLAPMQFIPIAEETGLILSIGRWVLKTACEQNVAWQKQSLPAIRMAVNLSIRQIMDPGLITEIRNVLRDTGMAPDLLELEITESMIMSNPKHMIAMLNKMKRLGIKLSIDDFGTGYSSLSKLKDFPIDTLKIDRSFIRNLPENAEDRAITQAILAMGESLSLNVIAEGVETEAQLDFLKEQLCDEVQGFYFNKPMEPEKFASFLLGQPNIVSPESSR